MLAVNLKQPKMPNCRIANDVEWPVRINWAFLGRAARNVRLGRAGGAAAKITSAPLLGWRCGLQWGGGLAAAVHNIWHGTCESESQRAGPGATQRLAPPAPPKMLVGDEQLG